MLIFHDLLAVHFIGLHAIEHRDVPMAKKCSAQKCQAAVYNQSIARNKHINYHLACACACQVHFSAVQHVCLHAMRGESAKNALVTQIPQMIVIISQRDAHNAAERQKKPTRDATEMLTVKMHVSTRIG